MCIYTYIRQTGKSFAMSLLGIIFSIGCCSCACVLVVTLAAVESGPCSSCTTNAFEDEMDVVEEGELRQLMIEHIKMQILQKLRMTAPPRVTKPVIPDVLLKKHLLEENDDDQLDRGFSRDDFYGRAEEVIIFPDNISTHNCYSREEDSPNSCFLFSLNRNVTTRNVRSAELWVYATDNSTSTPNKTYIVSEMIRDPRRHRDGILERVVAIGDTSATGWIKFELGPAVRTWSHSYHLTHAIQISCAGCDHTLESPVSIEDGQKPFLIVHTNAEQRETSRGKRSTTCREGITTCCKETFLLYFEEIGWDDWIVRPEFYEANFCRGSCMTDVNASLYHHTTAIRRYLQTRNQNNSNTMNLCCVASRLKPLTIYYVEKNSKIVKSVLPNMVVESCDCV